ncbi:MAG: dephospho-CoA kinase [Verrucomicrobia bacterium]|nr:dephospho-CoA kinase [Verrucomicrobiota bacterium]
MKLISLTGGVGMGKTTVAKCCQARGLPVVDTDALAHEAVAPGQPALAEIARVFGPSVLDAEGQLRRSELARLVFADAIARGRLEAILHPRIRERWGEVVVRWRGAGEPAGVVVIPLLFETGAEREFDTIFCVACSAATQEARLAERGWSHEECRQRIQAQWPIERKLDLAHRVIWTEGPRSVTARQVERALDLDGIEWRRGDAD